MPPLPQEHRIAIGAKVLEACYATLAAALFFGLIAVGRSREEIVLWGHESGQSGVGVMESGLGNIGPEPLKSRINGLVSIGSSRP